MRDEIVIKQTRNGFYLERWQTERDLASANGFCECCDRFCIASDDGEGSEAQALKNLFLQLKEWLAEESRYSKHRVMVSIVPGDKCLEK